MSTRSDLTGTALALALSLAAPGARAAEYCVRHDYYEKTNWVSICTGNHTVEATARVTCNNVPQKSMNGSTNVTHIPGEHEPSSVNVTLVGRKCNHDGCPPLADVQVPVEIIYYEECGSCTVGTSESKAGSLRHRINLGKASDGRSTGFLELYTDSEPDAWFATPAALKLLSRRDTDPVCDRDTGQLRQLLAAECFVTVEPVDEHRYTVSFYTPDSVEPEPDTNGWYVLKSGASTFSHFLVENPDTSNAFRRLRIARTANGETRATEYAWERDGQGRLNWSLGEGGGLQEIGLCVEPYGEGEVKTWTTRAQGGVPVAVERKQYMTFGGARLLTQAVRDPDGAALTTRYEYTDSGALRLTVGPDGSWSENVFAGGWVSERRSGWLDAGTNAAEEATQATAYGHEPFLTAAESNAVVTVATNIFAAVTTNDLGVVTTNEYSVVETNTSYDVRYYLWPDSGVTDPGTPRVETVTAAGVPVAKTLRVIYTDTMGYKTVGEVRLLDPSRTDHAAAYADPANPRTVRTYMPKNDGLPWSERPETALHPDGRTEAWDYVAGTYDAGGAGAPGTFTEDPDGDCVRVTLTRATAGAPDGTAFRTTRETTVETLVGRVLQTETHLYGGGGYELLSWRKNTVNDLGQVVATAGSDGTLAETEWSCCGPSFETAADGSVAETLYDALRRPIRNTSLGEGARPDIFAETVYDAAGRATFRRTYAGSLSQTTTNAYDLAGRLTWSRGPDGVETDYSYGSNSVTTVRGGLTNLSVRFADGRSRYTEQNGVRQTTHAYGVNSDGTQWTLSAQGELPAGLQTTLELPNFSTLELLDFPWEIGIADPLGRTVAQIRPGYGGTLLVTSNSYDIAGRLCESVSVRGSEIFSRTLFTYDDLGEPLLTCEDLDLDGTIDLSGPDRVNGRSSRYVQLSGDWWHESASWTYAGDGSSAPLTNAVSRNRLKGLDTAFSADGATGTLTAESVSVDARGNQTVSRTVIDRGNKTVYRLTYTPGSSVAALTTTVDGRLVSSRSTSGLATTYAYDALGRMTASQDARGGVRSRGYDEYGRVAWDSDPATNGTWYAYDDFGRRIAVTNALGEVTHTEYDLEGRAVKTYGATYPVEYDYDAFGRMTAMRTFRDEQGAGDETRWLYDAPTGLLTNKVYADGKGTSYTYTPDGQLASRTWARGITTTYTYTNDSSLAAIDYSDDTPDVFFQYDRLGRMTSAIVAGVSTNTFTYDGIDLVAETQNGAVITRATDALGRPAGFSLGLDYAVEYSYDTYGRFVAVTSSVASASLGFAYSYLEDSDLISGMTASSGFLWARAYESRSLITAVENRYGEAVISRYDYENNELGQRTHIERSGMSFGGLPVRDAYEYNPRSEVTSARRTPVGSQTELRGFSYDYTYDPIGNRVTSTEYDHAGDALESEYTSNALNQYGQRTVPGYAGVRGEADTNATVTVNADPAWRWGEYFYGGDDADNSLAAGMKELEITATYSNLFTSVTGRVFVAETPESFTYDDDGNLTQDGRFAYTWDAENRLIGVTTRADLPARVPRLKAEYVYDHQARRIASSTAVWTNDAWQAVESRAFLYDRWNVIRETVAVGSGSPQWVITNLYTWGIDLSGSLQGAGGIGGLLAASLDGTNALYCYDANGNVGQLVGTNGDLLAHYEYSPFGETIVATGPLAEANSFRFSTKWFDNDTELGYWGYRWYSSGIGRWLSKDPIEEEGGLNVYAFCRNDSVAIIDPLGLLNVSDFLGGFLGLKMDKLYHKKLSPIAIGACTIEGTIWYRLTCCPKGTKNAGENKFIIEIKPAKITCSKKISLLDIFLKKNPYTTVIASIMDATGWKPADAGVEVAGSGAVSAHWDGCVEKILSASGKVSVSGDPYGNIKLWSPKYSYQANGKGEGSVTISVVYTDRTVSMEASGSIKTTANVSYRSPATDNKMVDRHFTGPEWSGSGGTLWTF